MAFKNCARCKKVTFHDADGDCWGKEFTKETIDDVESIPIEDLQEDDLVAYYSAKHDCKLSNALKRDEFAREQEGYDDYEEWCEDYEGETYYVIRPSFVIEEALV